MCACKIHGARERGRKKKRRGKERKTFQKKRERKARRTVANKNDWGPCGSDCRKGATTLCVAIKLGNDDGADVNLFAKGFCLALASLADGRVHHKHNLVWVNRVGHLKPTRYAVT